MATVRPTPELTAPPSARPSPSPDPTPAPPASLAIATARTRAIGSEVMVEGTVTAEAGRILGERTLVLQDATGGLPVRLPSVDLVGDYPRGAVIRVTGELAEPYGNLELRPASDDALTVIGSGGLPDAESLQSAGLAEASEGLLATLTATIEAVDRYQSGAVSIVVGDASGSGKLYAFAPVELDIAGLERGQRIRAVGIVGQRASSSGAGDGHRLWLRGSADLAIVAPAPTPAPSAAPGDGDPTRPRPRRVRIADAVEGETVVIVGVVTSRPGLVHGEGRRVTVQDSSGAILVRYPADASPDRVGSVIRAVGEVGTWFDARQLEADKKPRRKRSGRVRVTDLGRPPVEAQEWLLVRVSARITDVERDGDSWRAEAALAGGQRLPIVGLAGSGIDGDLLEPGRSARITGLVKRAHPAATDQRFAIAPRSRKDIRLGRLQPVGDEGAAADDHGVDDEDDGLVGPAGGSGTAVFAATFGRLDGLEDRLVRVGGRVSQIAGQRLTLDDGTAEGVVRLADSVERTDPAIRVGEILNAVGRVERHRRRGLEVVVKSGTDVRRAARLSGPGPGPSAPVAPVDPPGLDVAGAHAEPPDAAPVLPLLLLTGVLGLLATSLLAAAGFVHRREPRPGADADPEPPSVVA